MANNAEHGLSMNGNLGMCSFCRKKADTKCNRCGDFYCSEFCQSKDWPSHRFICFPMPKLVKAGESINMVEKDLQPRPMVQEARLPNNVAKKDFQPQPTVKETKSANLIQNGSCVILTGFKSSDRCFIRSTNPSTVAEYNKVLNDINEFGKRSSALSEYPKCNSYALSLRDGKWCRVKILENAQRRYRVCYVDFGDSKILNFKDLKKIEPSLANLPCFVHMVQLKGKIILCNQVEFLKCLSQYTNKEYKVVFSQQGKLRDVVDLFQWGTNILLNSIIEDLTKKNRDNGKNEDQSIASSSSHIDLQNNGKSGKKDHAKEIQNDSNGLQTKPNSSPFEKTIIPKALNTEIDVPTKNFAGNPTENNIKATVIPRQIQEPCLKPPFEIIPLNEKDKNCRICITDNSYVGRGGYIGCLLEQHFDNLKSISKFLEEHDAGDQPYKPELNEYCLAKYENEWYRAQVADIPKEGTYFVFYIDFMNDAHLTSESIRRYPISLDFPLYTTLCAIDGLPNDIPENIKRFLESNCDAFTFLSIDSVRLDGDNFPHITSNELLNKMRDAKLL